jgi:hypothetical protein
MVHVERAGGFGFHDRPHRAEARPNTTASTSAWTFIVVVMGSSAGARVDSFGLVALGMLELVAARAPGPRRGCRASPPASASCQQPAEVDVVAAGGVRVLLEARPNTTASTSAWTFIVVVMGNIIASPFWNARIKTYPLPFLSERPELPSYGVTSLLSLLDGTFFPLYPFRHSNGR